VISQRALSGNGMIVARMLELIDSYFSGDPQSWDDAVPELFTADVEIIPSSALASGTALPYRGHEGARRWLADVMDEWPRFRSLRRS
jgi:hypothetical protein